MYPPGGAFGPRRQNYWVLVMIHTGSLAASIDGELHHAAENTVFLFHPHHTEYLEFSANQETVHTWVRFHLAGVSQALHRHLVSLPRPIPMSARMLETTQHALGLHHGPRLRHNELSQALALYLFWLYVDEAERIREGQAGSAANLTVIRAKEFIHAHLFDPLTAPLIAGAASISVSQLTRLFHREVAVAPMEYVWRLRTHRGLNLLKNTGLPVGVIAHQCGFKSQAHFARRVTQATGLSPRQVRQRV